MTFSHELRDGAAGASYGVEVARSGGVPNPVVSRAHELLDADARGDRFDSNGHADADVSTNGDLPPGVRERLEAVDVATTTPMEALELLAELKRDLEE